MQRRHGLLRFGLALTSISLLAILLLIPAPVRADFPINSTSSSGADNASTIITPVVALPGYLYNVSCDQCQNESPCFVGVASGAFSTVTVCFCDPAQWTGPYCDQPTWQGWLLENQQIEGYHVQIYVAIGIAGAALVLVILLLRCCCRSGCGCGCGCLGRNQRSQPTPPAAATAVPVALEDVQLDVPKAKAATSNPATRTGMRPKPTAAAARAPTAATPTKWQQQALGLRLT
jgi:hypothetical protein